MRKFILSLLILASVASYVDAGCFFRRRVCCNNVAAVVEVPVIATPAIVATFVPVQVPTYSVTYAPNTFVQTQETVYQQQTPIQQYAATPVQQQVVVQPQAVIAHAAPTQQVCDICAELAAIRGKLDLLENQFKTANGQPISGPQSVPTAKPGVAALPSPPSPGASQGQAASSAALSIFNAKCAACHESKVAPANGKGFVLLVGNQPNKLSPAQVLKIVQKVYKNEMPKLPNKFGIPSLTDQEVGEILKWSEEYK
jgi:mono/diheme cytochrome c family protein